MVKSVVLAWGSLVWDPGALQTAGKFTANGPLLPIEFCRVSDDGRLTLAIDESFGALCKTYSAPSALESLDAARDDLCLREGMADARAVGFVEPASGRQSDFALESHPQVVATIAAWAESLGYDSAIWSALASNFDDWGKGGEPFSVSAALQYL
jgi:predicted trehalose synthase